ncbi:CHC2 zinc finger domain-containing protein [Pandoraea terrae]
MRLIEAQGHEIKRRGRDWVMRCVFHEEDTPSLTVSSEKNVYHCFGCPKPTLKPWTKRRTALHGKSIGRTTSTNPLQLMSVICKTRSISTTKRLRVEICWRPRLLCLMLADMPIT